VSGKPGTSLTLSGQTCGQLYLNKTGDLNSSADMRLVFQDEFLLGQHKWRMFRSLGVRDGASSSCLLLPAEDDN